MKCDLGGSLAFDWVKATPEKRGRKANMMLKSLGQKRSTSIATAMIMMPIKYCLPLLLVLSPTQLAYLVNNVLGFLMRSFVIYVIYEAALNPPRAL